MRSSFLLSLVACLSFLLLGACGTEGPSLGLSREKLETLDGRAVAHVTCTAFVKAYAAVEESGAAPYANGKLKDLIDLMAERVENPSLRRAVLEARKAAEDNPVQNLEVYEPVVKGCQPYL